MKKLIQSAFLVALAAVFVLGLSLVVTPEAEAGFGCPPCYVPPGASGWSQYGSCTDFSDPHCPIDYRTYRNNYTGQICRGQSGTPI